MEKYQAKSITPIDVYKFTLPKEYEDIAKEELRETEEVRQHAIHALREWVLKNPRILMTRLDSNFLLRFLRFRKFSVPMAMEAMERYMVIKNGGYGKRWFDDIDITKPSVMNLLDAGFVFYLPERDSLGRRVVFFRPGVTDPMLASVGSDVIALTSLVLDLLCSDEENQIKGVVYVSDAKGVKMPHFTVFTPQYYFRVGKSAEKTVTLRHKAFHVVNVHRSLAFISEVILSNMGEKLKKRVRLYSSFDEFTAVDKKHLPKEFGGVVPMKDMIELMKKELLAHREFHKRCEDIRVNVDMYPKQVLEGSLKSLKYNLNSPELYEKFKTQTDIYGAQGVQGSFRKLEID